MGHMVFEVNLQLASRKIENFKGGWTSINALQRDLFDVRRRVLDPIIKPSERH